MEITTEKQKMLSGQLYFPSDKQLQQEREAAKKLCHQFNLCGPDERKQGMKILKSLFGSNNTAWIEPPFYCDYGYNIVAGKQFYANHGCVILDTAAVTIGDDVLLAPGVLISTASHPLDPEQRRKGMETALPITIGNNVWIGMGAKILPGVEIGDNAVIGAGAVVTKSVEANCVYAGVPARLIDTIPSSKPK